MRIIVNGQQAFGKSVLEALLDRGEEVVGAYCEPDRPGGRPDPLKVLAGERGVPVFQPRSFRKPEVWEQMRSLAPDLCVMAYVTLFVPEQALSVPTHGSIQYHPSLLPRHRGPSSINWPIIWGEQRTGLSIFWPDDGLDEGPVLMQKEVDIGEDDTLGSLYFERLFPLGVQATLESVDLVREGRAPRVEQDHSAATYEGWCRDAVAGINWNLPLAMVSNLVRGCDPAPGAWTTLGDRRLRLFESSRVQEAKSVQPGQVTAVEPDGISIATADGQLKVGRIRPDGGKKMPAAEFAAEAEVKPGTRFG